MKHTINDILASRTSWTNDGEEYLNLNFTNFNFDKEYNSRVNSTIQNIN